ncbi:hemerythrin family protein [Roseovarius sp. Pro17]|uniref:bacteriohemerythrin n=1 Tax=Roseovarius sp. Pro17 TaxID=3108175 RepID=UPI002D7944EB|nr:hemerythrin family protein [Roseovarius sp. Pro17]
MAPIEWKTEYSVGNPSVDHEHQELIDLVNQTASAILDNEPEADIQDSFGDLLRAITAHFALEEQQMKAHGYDQRDQHKEHHERLLDELRDIMDSDETSPDKTAERLATTLEAWFGDHFKTHDARLHNRLGPHPHT